MVCKAKKFTLFFYLFEWEYIKYFKLSDHLFEIKFENLAL